MKRLNKFSFSTEEEIIRKKIIHLKKAAGTHSPSIQTIIELIPELNIKVDACFLSNPYATELYMNYFKSDVIDQGKLRDLLEFYPSQNSVIAGLVSKAINIDSNKIFIGNGAIEIIQAIIHRFAREKIVINIPTFSSYYEFALENLNVNFFVLDKELEYNLDIVKYINYIKDVKPDTIVIINPNNPTGNYIIKNDLIRILDELSFVENIIIDESFIHFAFEDDLYNDITLSNLATTYKNLYIVKSMSKDFGIAGIRAGYAIMAEDKVQVLLKNGYLWNSNGLAEHFFRLYCLPDFVDKYQILRKKYIKETQEFIRHLEKVPRIKVYSSTANFVLIELPEGLSAEIVTSILLIRHSIYVRNCDDKKGLNGNFIRIASRNKEDNHRISESLMELFS